MQNKTSQRNKKSTKQAAGTKKVAPTTTSTDEDVPQKITGARALVAALVDEGVDTIFGYPGGTVLDIYDALYDCDQIRHILVRHEQSAAHAADGYARTAKKPGVVLVTSGPGATNTVTGIADAYMDSIPIVVIAGQVATNAIGTDAFQEADFLGITLPVTKHSYLIKDVKELVPSVREAFHIAKTGRPGPVVICVPSDVALELVKYEPPTEKVNIPSYKPTYKGNARQIKQAANLMQKAKKPVIIAGGGIVLSGAEKDLCELAEILQIPVVETLMARGVFAPNNKLNLGRMGMHGTPQANLAVLSSDLLIVVGSRLSNRVTGDVSEFAENAKVIHIDIDPAEIGKNVHVDLPIVGDAHEVLSALVEQLNKTEIEPKTTNWVEQVNEWKQTCVVQEHVPKEGVICAQEIFDALNELTKNKDVIYTTEVGEHQMWASQYLDDRGVGTFITSGGAGTMGFGIPAAMGVQFACPDKMVICLAGDGSVQMSIQEMATCTQYGLPIKILIFNNGKLGMVRQMQELFYTKRYSATDMPRIPDFAMLASAYGWQGEMVADPSELKGAVARLIDAKGPALLDVHMSDEEMVFPAVRNGAAISKMIGVDGLEHLKIKEGK